jgi:hypothetical protein
LQAGTPPKGKKLDAAQQKQLVQQVARDAYATINPQNANTANVTPTATVPTVTPTATVATVTPTAQPSGPVNTWLAAQPGQPPLSKAVIKQYMATVLNERAQKAAAQGKQYEYIRTAYNQASAAFKTLDDNAAPDVVQALLTEHLNDLIDMVNDAMSKIEKVETKAQSKEADADRKKEEAARIEANKGDGGYPVDLVEGAGENTVMVVLNQVIPARTGTRYVIWLQHHQNKHQAGSARIPQIGIWKKKTGTTFLKDQGLQWHKDTTALWVLDWLQKNRSQLKPDGTKLLPDKTTTVDSRGITYDLSAWLEDGMIMGSYHCNPKE